MATKGAKCRTLVKMGFNVSVQNGSAAFFLPQFCITIIINRKEKTYAKNKSHRNSIQTICAKDCYANGGTIEKP